RSTTARQPYRHWRTILFTLTTFSPSGIDQLRGAMNGYVERGDAAGLVMLLSRQGETWIESLGVRDLESRAPMTADTIFRIASMTKPVTEVAAMMLVEDGTLALDDPMNEWLPELANQKAVRSTTGPLDDSVPATRPLTLRDLLTFSLGLGALMLEEG